MKFLSFSALLFVFFTSFSQQSSLVQIEGIVLDSETKTPLEYATITFKDSTNKRIFLGALTNSKGKFLVEIKKGNYQITIEYLGFQQQTSSLSVSINKSLGKIYLKPAKEQLHEVVVTSQKSIQIRNRKISLITSKDISSKGNNALEILNNIPTVHTNNTGTVTVDGYKTATILINGKKSALSKSDVLKTISAASIKKIDVISHPGAQYNANDQAIINIILKRGKNNGLHGSVTSTIGYKNYYGILVNIHHKTKKINFYANISSARKKNYLNSAYQNEYYNNLGESQSYLHQKILYDNTKDTYFANVGATFNVSDRTHVNTNINLYTIKKNAFTQTNTLFNQEGNLLTTYNKLDKTNNYKDYILEAQIDIEHQFSTNGTFLVALSQTLDKEKYQNRFSNSNSTLKIANTLDKNYLKNTQISTKFTQGLSKTSTLTFGYDAEFGAVPFNHYSNTRDWELKYQETNYAGFFEFEYEKDSWYIGTGIRAEFFKIKTNYITENTIQKRNYNNLFPVVYIQKELTDYSNITFDYNTKIGRPSFYKIQPFNQVTSETSSFRGNPKLAPIFIYNYAITYTYSKSNFTFRPSLKYSYFKDIWRNVTYDNGTSINGVPILITQPFNVGSTNYYVANITAMYRASNKLNFTFNTNLIHLVNHGKFNITNTADTPITIDYKHKNNNADFSLITRFTIAKGFNLQNQLYHSLDSNGPVSKRKNFSYATLSLSKEVMNTNGTISFTTNDVFNSNRTRRTYFNNYYTSVARIKNQYPTYLVSFTYRFNQLKNKQKINFTKKDQTPQF